MAEAAPETIPRSTEKLAELTSAAELQFTLKNFAAAADRYAQATEIQAELNGEVAPENAQLLFYYGRALYKVALQKTDVLGSKVAQEESKKPKASKKAQAGNGEASGTPANGAASEPKEDTVESKPFFQLTGDENWTDSEHDEDDEDAGEEAEEDQDDLGNAYETFEIARVLYTKQLEALEGSESADKGKGKAELTPEARAIKAKLADCHGFLAEISMESEKFHGAIADARKSLELQEELLPSEHDHVIEAHYQLSLALEFASVRKVREDQTGPLASSNGAEAKEEEEEEEVDYELRKEAALQTELCVRCLEARLKTARGALTQPGITPEKKRELEFLIKDKTEILDDMKVRLADLQADPKAQTYEKIDESVFAGMLQGLLGADAATQKAKLEEATKNANDVTSVVRKKEKAPATIPTEAGSSKRKLEVDEDADNGKRAKTEEIP